MLLHRGRSRLREAMERPGRRMRLLRRDEALVCQEMVELVTDYLEGALDALAAPTLRGPPRRLRALQRVPRPDARDDSPDRSTAADDLTPAMREEFVQLYRRWRAEGD